MSEQASILTQQPKVAILMCTYNGEAFLKEQMDSFVDQACGNCYVWVSDDRSTDTTLSILESYKSKFDNRLTIVQGPKKGFAENFLSLVCNKDVTAEYYAYSDQDDIWHADKLDIAVAWLDKVPKDVPALYGARSVLVDEKNNEIGTSNLFVGPFGFKNAMVQNVAAGNTMVFNQAACDLLREAGTGINVAFHDWWTYIVVSGCGGQIYIDQTPVLRYRQHGNNIIGCNNGFKAKMVRLKRLLCGHMRYWNTQHVKALYKITHRLSEDNLKAFNLFAKSRDRFLFPRLIGIYRSGIYRQTRLGNIALVIATFLRKL